MGTILIVGSSTGGFPIRSPNEDFGIDGDDTGSWIGSAEGTDELGSVLPPRSPKLDF